MNEDQDDEDEDEDEDDFLDSADLRRVNRGPVQAALRILETLEVDSTSTWWKGSRTCTLARKGSMQGSY